MSSVLFWFLNTFTKFTFPYSLCSITKKDTVKLQEAIFMFRQTKVLCSLLCNRLSAYYKAESKRKITCPTLVFGLVFILTEWSTWKGSELSISKSTQKKKTKWPSCMDSWEWIPNFSRRRDEIISTCYLNAKNSYLIPISKILWDSIE